MLGDCYAAAVVEHLSKKELMALDALDSQDDSPQNDQTNLETDTELMDGRSAESVIINIQQSVHRVPNGNSR